MLAGRVNAGKSSLMNAFLGRKRAIVTEKPGTTRDYLEEQTSLAGLPVRLVDTAGLREHSDDSIELEGMRRGKELADNARCVLVVLDGARAEDASETFLAPFAEEARLIEEFGAGRCIAVWNKADIKPLPKDLNTFHQATMLPVCARSGEGIDRLAEAVRALCLQEELPQEGDLAPNLRQTKQLRQALDALDALQKAIALDVPPDLCSIHLETACAHLSDITGLNSTEETLNAIFSTFCIGK